MTFAMSPGVPHPSGYLKWLMYEKGKRWPYYRGYILTNDYDTAYAAFVDFVDSARAHAKGKR